ncbi:MAG: biopolymer transporter ExbD [Gammaproteobacteria bacterium]|nr:MAG: biopolymer transporter ExbD [Gammaproteobacteria bacterium]
MKLRARDREEPEINLTSLIDVVLLLLVFFMVTTSFVRESQLAIRLPEIAAENAPAPEAAPLEITVTAQGDYLVNGRALVDNRPETLQAALRKLQPDAAGTRRITISADAQASHQAVVTAMDVAGRSGYSEISIATLRRREQGD